MLRDKVYSQIEHMGMLDKEDRSDQITKQRDSLERLCESLQEDLAETKSQLWVVRWENYDNKIEKILERNTYEWEKTLLDLL